MAEALAPVVAPTPLDARTLLRRIDQRLALLRTWLSHDHGDEPYWWARKTTAPQAQYERWTLRQVANLIHVRGATGLDMRRQIFFVSLGGFDTHDSQQLVHPAILGDLSASLHAFYQATVQMGPDGLLYVLTDEKLGALLRIEPAP